MEQNNTNAVGWAVAGEIKTLVAKKKVPEWIIIVISNIILLVGTMVLEQYTAGKLPMQAWGVSIIGVVMGIVRMACKTEQDKVLIGTRNYDVPAVSTDAPTTK